MLFQSIESAAVTQYQVLHFGLYVDYIYYWFWLAIYIIFTIEGMTGK